MPLHGLTSRCVLFALILFLTRVPGVYAEQHARALETDRPFLEQQSPTAPAACDCDTLSSHSSGVSTDTDERTWQLDALPRLRSALQVMQTTWFDIRLGTWPSGIDWTNAVIDTHLISVVGTLSKALLRLRLDGNGTGTGSIAASERELEDEIEWYFDHTIAYYYTEPSHSLRHQAYDDRLWVVLNWLESIKTIRDHSDRHYRFSPPREPSDGEGLSWHGEQFLSAFAHRARKFWDFAAAGWDEKFCGGGMLWNPRFAPYKNAVTNELFIAASVGMYLHSPAKNTTPSSWKSGGSDGGAEYERFNLTYLNSAIRAYNWLKQSNMTDAQGLYVDGYHISHLKQNNTVCDIRNEMVYTYNQGILLSGLRDLWEATGNTTYLLNAHTLVSAVINATGWDLASQRPGPERKGIWAGLGEGGILQDRCDVHGTCNQDAQMFKGILFLHFAAFCQLLPVVARVPGRTFGAGVEVAALHRRSCGGYKAWVEWNARGALGSRDEEGRMGGWWGGNSRSKVEGEDTIPEGAIDYRNNAGELLGELWQGIRSDQLLPAAKQQVLSAGSTLQRVAIYSSADKSRDELIRSPDPNVRGRGRTVETHSGGVAVLRALWELIDLDR